MKKYLKSHLPRITLILAALFFVSNLFFVFLPELEPVFLLYPSNISEPVQWYRLLTYPLCVCGLSSWFWNGLSLILTGFIMESRMKKQDILSIIFISTLIGGLVFSVINYGDILNIPIASPAMISWGYWSAAIIIGLKYRRTLNLFEKIILILSLINVLGIWFYDLGFLLGEISVIVVIAVLTILKYGIVKQVE